jgi:magnesium chelatase subunit I
MAAQDNRVNVDPDASILPYSYVVGQDQVKLALELAFVAPGIGGVLISGERGTAKSTVVRAFGRMVWDRLPVTLPLNASDDRVLGGWRLDELMEGHAVEQVGLLEEASDRGLLYVDEVNLLDDHIINIILDASSTGILTVQREALDRQRHVDFVLVGTMNPEEGGLRPQLLDRFGLMVNVGHETDPGRRAEILRVCLRMDQAKSLPASDFLERGYSLDRRQRLKLETARERLYAVEVPYDVLLLAANVAAAFQVAGHRGDIVSALAARACAAMEGADVVEPRHLARIAPLALAHRRSGAVGGDPGGWSEDDRVKLEKLIATPHES